MKFGGEIQVSGNGRPAWLSNDDTAVSWNDLLTDNPSYGATTAGRLNWFGVNRIRLTEDHFAYAAIAAGFEPWAGGNAAPDDWDGGGVTSVLFRDGETFGRCVGTWSHQNHLTADSHIIGYKKRVDPVAAAEPTTQPDTDPTVALLTEIRDLLKPKMHNVAYGIDAMGTDKADRISALLRSSPTRAIPVADLFGRPEPEPLTIRITGPQGSGKTRWAEVIRNLPAALLGFPVPVVVDGEVVS